jgi:hypothetical protein
MKSGDILETHTQLTEEDIKELEFTTGGAVCAFNTDMIQDCKRYRALRDPDNFPPDESNPDGPSLWDQLCNLEGDDFDQFIDERVLKE